MPPNSKCFVLRDLVSYQNHSARIGSGNRKKILSSCGIHKTRQKESSTIHNLPKHFYRQNNLTSCPPAKSGFKETNWISHLSEQIESKASRALSAIGLVYIGLSICLRISLGFGLNDFTFNQVELIPSFNRQKVILARDYWLSPIIEKDLAFTNHFRH